uniref:Uncharacterized protein n=1 Tax=Heterorhabditis bacteriophora TaxID=37862 RepID=A0A1I7XDR8_HETBA
MVLVFFHLEYTTLEEDEEEEEANKELSLDTRNEEKIIEEVEESTEDLEEKKEDGEEQGDGEKNDGDDEYKDGVNETIITKNESEGDKVKVELKNENIEDNHSEKGGVNEVAGNDEKEVTEKNTKTLANGYRYNNPNRTMELVSPEKEQLHQ